MVVFLDYDGVVNTVVWEINRDTGRLSANYSYPWLGRVNNYQAIQWLSELCEKYDLDIVVTSTWRLNDNYKECLIEGGLRTGIDIVGRVTKDHCLTRAEQINLYLNTHPAIGNKFIIIDDDDVDMSAFGYNNAEHFIKCTTNGGFQLEEFEKAQEIVKNLIG